MNLKLKQCICCKEPKIKPIKVNDEIVAWIVTCKYCCAETMQHNEKTNAILYWNTKVDLQRLANYHEYIAC